jgi:hypothetical protein
MPNCVTCRNWTLSEVTAYRDGSVVVEYQAPPDNGRCAALKIETKFDFGCVAYVADEGWDHVKVLATKDGAPWQHFKMIPCPDCNGGIHGACRRCAGTGLVRLYDDGYVGEEQTRMHPVEKQIAEAEEREKIRKRAQALLDGVKIEEETIDGTKLKPISKPDVFQNDCL